MHKKILLTALLSLLWAGAHAQTATNTTTTTTTTNTTTTTTSTATDIMSKLTVAGTMDYETQYIFRGKKVTNGAFQPSVQFGYPVYGGSVYAGLWTNQPAGRAGTVAGPNQHGEIDLYGGYTYPLDFLVKTLSVDVGYMYYWYPDVGGINSAASQNQEVHIGFTYDTTSAIGFNLSPSFFYYHDFILDQNDFELGISYTYDLSGMTGLKGLSVVPAATVGWLGGNHELGAQVDWPAHVPGGPTQNWRNAYTYYLFKVDLNYKITDWATAFIGFRYSGNNDGTGQIPPWTAGPATPTAQSPGTANSIWGGAGVKFSL